MAASMGHAAAFGTGAASPVSEQFEFISADIGKRATQLATPGMRGTRSMQAFSVNDSIYTVGGSVVLEPRPDDLDIWLPRILGATESTDIFALAETLPVFFANIDKVAKVYEFTGCKVNRAVFRSSAGQNLQLTLEIEGLTESEGAAGSFPAISGTLSVMQPYIHHQAVLTLDSVVRPVNNVEITIDNALILDRHNNSQPRTELPESDRIITVTCDNPFTSVEADLYDMAVAGVTGSIVYTNSSRSVLFTFANLKAPARPPVVGGKTQEIPLRLEMTAYETATTKELVVTNDPVE